MSIGGSPVIGARVKTLLSFSFALVSTISNTRAADWPQFRGPNRDGVSAETNLLKDWPADGPPLAWQIKGLGKGLASVAIADGRIFTVAKRKDGQYLVAFDLNTQKELWASRLSEKGDDPQGAPSVSGSLVFAVSKDGKVICCEAANGKEVWHKDFVQDFGGKMMSGWGYSESPLIDGDRIVLTPGGNDAALVALTKNTGDVIWKAPLPEGIKSKGNDGAGYTGAVVSNAGGIRQYVTLLGHGVLSVAAADGKPLWHYNRVANGTANIPTPLAWDDYVFASTGYGAGAALLKVVPAASSRISQGSSAAKDGDKDQQAIPPIEGSPLAVQEQYFLKASTFQNHHGGMVRLGDYIYAGVGHNNGFPLCLNWKTGEVVWKKDRGPGSESAAMIAADGRLYFRYQNGIMALIGATPDGYEEHGVFKLPSVDGPSWSHPAIQNGKLYLRDQDTLFCYDIRQK